MESDRELADQTNAMDSPPDLQQVKDALSLLRVSSPESVLADLVEEKIRTMENGGLTLPQAFSPTEGGPISRREAA